MDDLIRLPDTDPAQAKRRIALAAGLSILWTAFVLLAQFSGALDAFEEPLLDWRQSLSAGPLPPSEHLALVAIDKIPADRPWPWSRLEYSLTLRALIDYIPQSIVFDMNLNDRDTEYTVYDETFAHIVQRANVVVFASTAMSQHLSSVPPTNLSPIPFHGDTRLVPQFGSIIWPMFTFAGNSPVGANNLVADTGAPLRSVPLVVLLNDKMIPTLVLQATAQYLGADLPSSEVQIGRAVFLKGKDGKLLRTIPIDGEGRMRVRYYPGPSASWVAPYENIVVYDYNLRHNLTPEHSPRLISKRQVWIGRTDPGDRERFSTAVGQLSHVEIEMQAARNILDQDYVRPLPPMILAMLYLLIGVIGAAALIRFGPLHAAALLVVAGLFWFESSLLGFRVYNVILPLPSFALLILGTYGVGLLARHWDMEPDSEPPEVAAGK